MDSKWTGGLERECVTGYITFLSMLWLHAWGIFAKVSTFPSAKHHACTIAFVLVLHFIPHVHPFCVAEQSCAKTPPPHLISTIVTYTGPCRFQDDPLLVRIPCSPQEGELVTVSAACASDWEYDKNRPCGPLGIFSKGRNVFNSFFKIEFSLIETQLFVLPGLTTSICSRGGGVLHFCVYNPKYI